jgi:mono/diheme cytochrome c family protein
VDAAGDVVIEAENSGTDTVRASVSHTLRANVENLVQTGTAAVNGTGNELANSLRGNGAANVLNGLAADDLLSGGAGNDRLIGGPGNDQLSGGLGEDAFQFDAPLDAATNQDRLVDFNPAADSMRLIGEAFPTLTSAGTLPASAFANGIVASGAAVRILYDAATGILRYDPDGSGPEASVRFARLTTTPAVTNADFTVVNPVATAVDYTSDIQPVFTNRCTGCHSGGGAPQGLQLDAANSYADLVNVASNEVPSLLRVEPGNPDDSYLVHKIEGTAAVGGRMPLGGTPLSAETIALIRQWISEGANP